MDTERVQVPKVSVIVPVYNTEDYLRECLDSVINQTLKDIEIICIDDGSTDNSLTILKEYANKDSRIVVVTQRNKGGGAARNQGLKYAKGKFLSFIDSDDFYNPETIEKMYTKAIDVQADIVICGVRRFNNKFQRFEECPWGLRVDWLPDKEVFNYKDMPKYIFNSFQNWNCNKMFRHEFIKDNDIKFQEIFRTNDLMFTCSALVLANKITAIQEPLFNYRVNIVSCQTTNHLYPIDFFKAFKALRKFLLDKGIYNEVEESYVNWALSGCIHNIKSVNISSKEKIYEILSKHFSDIGIIPEVEDLIWEKTKYKNLIDSIDNYRKLKFKRFIQNIFSIQNTKGKNGKKHKVITIFGIKIKIRRR